MRALDLASLCPPCYIVPLAAGDPDERDELGGVPADETATPLEASPTIEASRRPTGAAEQLPVLVFGHGRAVDRSRSRVFSPGTNIPLPARSFLRRRRDRGAFVTSARWRLNNRRVRKPPPARRFPSDGRG